MKKVLTIILVIMLILAFGLSLGITGLVNNNPPPAPPTPSPEPVNTATTTPDAGNAAAKADLIRLDTPLANQVIKSPLTIRGTARGTWFFEASFPVVLTDNNGNIIAQGPAHAQGDWMTTDFVPFEATLTFVVDPKVYSNRGLLILKKDNPSGLPAHDDSLEIPILFAK